MAVPIFDISYENSIIENAKNIESPLKVRKKQDDYYYFEDIFGDIENPITIKIKHDNVFFDTIPRYNVKNEQGEFLGVLNKKVTNEPLLLSKGNYIISVELYDEYFVPINLFLEVIKRQPSNIIKDNVKYDYNGKAHDVTENVKNNDGLKVIFLRNKVKEIGHYKIDFITEETDEFYSSSGSFNVEVVRSPSLIEHNEVINIIRNSLLEIMDNDYYYYKDYNVILAKEQEFIKLKQAKPNSIYIVIKFGSASINFSQTVLPITLTAMSEQNKLDVCQKLLSDFVNKYNLETNEDSTIRQIYELPVVTSNFNKVFEGFRSILFVNGYFVISKNANFYELESAKDDIIYTYNEEYINKFSIENDKFLIGVNNKEGTYSFTYGYGSWYVNGFETNFEEIKTKYGITFNLKVGASMLPNSKELFRVVYDNLWEDVPLLSFNFNVDFQLDSQPFFNRGNFSESVAKYGVLSFNINTYMLNDIDIINKALQMALKQSDASINRTFKLKIKLKNGIELIDTFKLLSLNSQQNIAEIPVVSLSFTN